MSAYSSSRGLRTTKHPIYATKYVSAATLFLKDIGHLVRSCNGHVYVRSGIAWTNSTVLVDKELLALCLMSNVVRPDTAGNVPTANRIVLTAKALMPNDATFQDILWRSNHGVICFNDGIYDFRARRFYTYDEREDVYPACVVPRDFPAKRPTDAFMAEVRSRILVSTLDSEEVVDTYLDFIARATAGEYADKQWGVMLGERNCGKGLLQEINESTWGPYVSGTSMSCEHTRQTYTNDVDLKTFQSNGAMKNQRYITTKLIMNLNEMPDDSPKEALSNMIIIKFPFKFVAAHELEQDPLPFFRARDDSIKTEYCKRPDVIDAFTWLVIDAYKDHPVKADTMGFLDDAGH